MRALLLSAETKSASVQEITAPQPAPGSVLIRVHSIALNPVDALYVSHPLASTGRTIGADFSGTVVTSTTPALAPGQRVAGLVQGANSINDRPGAFAEYVVCPADLVWVVPEGMSHEQAAGVSLCGLTAAQALFWRLRMPAPFDWDMGNAGRRNGEDNRGSLERETGLTFFIYGASTSVGMYAAQLLRLGCERHEVPLRLIGAVGRKHFDMLKGLPYGYDVLVDYRDEDWAEQVRTAAGEDGVEFGLDCISEGETVKQVLGVLRQGGRLAVVRSLEGGAWNADGVDTSSVMYGAVWEGLGVDIQYENLVVPATEESRSFTVAFYRWLSSGGGLEPNPIRLMPGGLDRVVPDGFALLGSGSMEDRAKSRPEEWMRPVSGEKLVYRV